MHERIEAYAQAMLAVARAENRLTDVEDEVFQFARTVERSEELRMALTDPGLPLARKLAVIEDLMGGRALQTSVSLVTLVVSSGHAGEMTTIVDRFVELAAAERSEEVAEVRTAIPLDDDQKARLGAALAQRTGKRIEVKVIIDPSVLGGISTRIGDTVIDGSIRHRLDQLKEAI